MKNLLIKIVRISFLFGVFSIYSFAQTPSEEILVYFASGINRNPASHIIQIQSPKLQQLFSRLGLNENSIHAAFPNFTEADIIRQLPNNQSIGNANLSKVFKISTPIGITRNSFIDSLKNIPGVLFAEPNGIAAPANTPNDQYFSNQWGLSNGGKDIHATEAWDIYTGTSNNYIAIIDGGIDNTHPDLSGKVYGDVGYGWNGHGIHVAGIAAAKTNNYGIGVSGVDWNAQLLAKRVDYTDDVGTYNQIVAAVNYNSNVNVLNNSWGLIYGDGSGGRYSTTVRLAFAYAYKMNRTAVVSMGNNNGSQTQFPAGFGQGIIAVGATDQNDVVAGFSNTGNHIDVAAPGQTILSTYRNGTNFSDPNYYYDLGTSMAAPFVSGIASLLKGYKSNLYNDDIEHIIQLSADDKGSSGWDSQYGYGRVNARRALEYLNAQNPFYQLTETGGNEWAIGIGPAQMAMFIYGASAYGLSDDLYYATRHEVRRTVSFTEFPAIHIPSVWARGVATNGWAYTGAGGSNFGMGYCEVVSGTITPSTATLRTYVYEIWSPSLQFLGWYPTTIQNATFAYSVIGDKIPPSPPTNIQIMSGSSPLHVQWSANSESLFDHFEVWREYYKFRFDHQPWTLIATTTNAYYNDPDFSAPGSGDYLVTYKVRAISNQSIASQWSSEISTNASHVFWKQGNQDPDANIPNEFSLLQNYPNPFNPTTTIRYAVKEVNFVSLKIYNMLGQEVAQLVNENKDPGYYSIDLNASNLPSGVYLYKLVSGNNVASKKMILTK